MSGSSIRFKRGNKADLPQSASSGTPLWCEDSKELYIGTDTGVAKVGTISQTTDITNVLNPVGINSNDTTSLKKNTSVSMQGGTITAQTFVGNLSGNATSATKDSSGNNIASTYLPKTGGTITGTLDLTKATDLSGTANNSPALRIGTLSGEHIEFDGNEIHAKATATSVGSLNINTDGGDVIFNSNKNPVSISGGNITATKFTGTLAGNATSATKATQDSSGNQINTNYMPMKYSEYAISSYAASNKYIKLATFTMNNTANYDLSYLFWVEILGAGAQKGYALVRLSARWSSSSYIETKFEILEKYGEFKTAFDTLVWAYKYTSSNSKGNIIGEIWLQTTSQSYVSYYLRPTQCCEYGDYSQISVKMTSNPWTYYSKTGVSTAVASTTITSGYTQVTVTDSSPKDNYYHPLLSMMWSDHLLNDSSWLRADTFSWHSGTTYSTAYNHLVADISGKTALTETINGTTVTFYLADDGHKIVLAAQESNVSSIYSSVGVAWYYILDTANTRFKLPRTQWGFKGYRNEVENYIAQNVLLPNITGSVGNWCSEGGMSFNGAFYATGSWSDGVDGEGGAFYNVNFDASRSSSVYSGNGTNTVIQERATQMYLYFYVGEYSRDALNQTAGLNSELFNNKADISAVTSLTVPDYSSVITGTQGSLGSWTQVSYDSFVVIYGTDPYIEDFSAFVSPNSGTTTYCVGKRYDDINGNTQGTSFSFLCPKNWYFKCTAENGSTYFVYKLQGAT